MASLASWNDTATREAIDAFVEGAAQEVPPEERVAVLDNGTLWCEKPMPVELGYVKGAERAIAQAEQDGWTVVSVKNDWATVFAEPS
jgi:hypothetical protein